MREEVSVLLVGETPVGVDELTGDGLTAAVSPEPQGGFEGGASPDVVVAGPDVVEEVVDGMDVPVVAATATFTAAADEWLPSDAPPELVAQRVRTVAEARRRERSERALLDDPLTARTIVDESGRVRDVNDAAVEFAGQPRSAVLGERIWELAWADRSPAAGERFRDAIERAGDGERVRERVEARDAGGALRTFDVLVRPLDGDRIIVEGRDVATIADEEAPLEPPSRRLRTIVDNLPIVLFALDEDGVFTLSEGRGLETLGLEPGEVVGESVFDVYDHPDVREAVERALDGEPAHGIVELGDVAFEAWYEPVYDGDEVRSVLGAAIDVTERVDREHELRQYETIVETIPDGAFVLDEAGTIRGGNETAARMFGFGYEELLDEPFETLVEDGVVDDSVPQRYVDIVRELLSDESDRQQGRLDFEVRPSDGGRRVVEVHIALRPGEAFEGTIGVVRDVTEHRERERQLRRQNERLEEFASMVSHDLRNPLGVARGSADLLADEVDSAQLDRIQRALARTDELVEDLLELARTGQTVTETEPVELATVVEDAWRTVGTAEADLVVATDAVVAADRSRLRQLLSNVLDNAVDHAGGPPRVEVGDLDGGQGFYVADDGPGIPEDDRERVLEYGYSTDEEGTGFGLAIVRSIAAAHGWDLRVTGSEAGGARLEFAGVEPAG